MAKRTGQLCGDYIAGGLLEDGAIQRLAKHSWMSDKPQKKVTA